MACQTELADGRGGSGGRHHHCHAPCGSHRGNDVRLALPPNRRRYSTGGSIDGMIAASDANLAATTNDTIIIPGHGRPVSNKAELKEFRDMLVAIRENVAKLKKQGRSRDETVAAKPTAAFDTKWGQFVIDPGYFTRLVYKGV
jgi:hypothetical protein